MYSLLDVVFRLHERGIEASPSTISRMVREGIVPKPTTVAGRHVWTDAGLDQLERDIREYRSRRGVTTPAA